jgi:hypothetical protein
MFSRPGTAVLAARAAARMATTKLVVACDEQGVSWSVAKGPG